jgi:hypothetical protein
MQTTELGSGRWLDEASGPIQTIVTRQLTICINVEKFLIERRPRIGEVRIEDTS